MVSFSGFQDLVGYVNQILDVAKIAQQLHMSANNLGPQSLHVTG